MPRTFRYIAALLLSATPSLSAAQQAPRSGARPSAQALNVLVDSVVHASLLGQGVPSVSVVVTRGDETLVERAWGRADVASGRAADPSTVYALGSIAKQFTAALVLRLVDRGQLALDDSIGRYLTGLRPEWGAIRIDQLLNHTSGLPRSGFVDMSRIREEVSLDSIVARAGRNPMVDLPGSTFVYSNTGYVVLAHLIEKLYGKPYAEALRDEIARPLGLTSLRYCGHVDAAAAARGYRHASFDGALSAAPPLHPSQMLGPSGVCTTAADLARWNRALHGGRVLSDASYRAMITPRGAARTYGFGLVTGRVQWGDAIIEHGGEDVSGFVAENAWYPADSLSVTILYNASPVVTSGGTRTIAALALGEAPPTTRLPVPIAGATSPAAGVGAEEAQRQFVGDYRLNADAVFTVDLEGGDFFLTPPGGEATPLVHTSGATYGMGSATSDTRITFLVDERGMVVGIMVQGEGPERRLRKLR